MSCYPPETIRALDRQYDAEARSDYTRRINAEMFEDAVKAGIDIRLPVPLSMTNRTALISEFLVDPPSKARALLLQACQQAMSGRDAGEALREYVRHVACGYGDDAADAWGGE